MSRRSRRLAAVLVIGIALPLSACAQTSTSSAPAGESPAKVEKIGDTGVSRLTLTEKAVERLAIETKPVGVGAAGPAPSDASSGRPAETGTVVPYAALLYQPDGATFVYTSPGPRTYVRNAVVVKDIVGQQVLLTTGPPVGTAVVTTGAAELWGTEFKIGKY